MSNLIKSCKELHDQFSARLGANETEAGTIIDLANNAIQICTDFLDQLKAIIIRQDIITKTEEVHFFKVAKPRFSSRFIYFTHILNFHANWPAGSRQLQKEHVEETLGTISKYYRNNKPLYEYYRAGHTHHDEQYFLRSGNKPGLFSGLVFNDVDRTFCTSHDGKIAQILAYDILEKHLQEKLDEMENRAPEATINKDFTWDYHKTALVELIYGFQEMQPCSKKQLSIKDIANHIGKAFNINISEDIYKIYNEMCQRKTDRTKFLDQMREKLRKRMEEEEK